MCTSERLADDRMSVVATGVSRSLAKSLESISPTASMPSICCVGLPLKRTLKLLMAVARGDTLVTEGWMHECLRLGRLVDTAGFLLPPDKIPPGVGREPLREHSIRLVGATNMPPNDLIRVLSAAGAQACIDDAVAKQEAVVHPVLIRKGHGVWTGCNESDLLGAIMQGEFVQAQINAGHARLEAQATAGHEPVKAQATGGHEPVENQATSGHEPAEAQAPTGRTRRNSAGPPRRRTSGACASSTATPQLLELAGRCDAPTRVDAAQLQARLLPVETSCAGGRSYFQVEDALQLYRKRLPRCDVLLVEEAHADNRRAGGGEGQHKHSHQRSRKRLAERDFLRDLVEAELARTIVLTRGDAAGTSACTCDEDERVLAACTCVCHRAVGMCELQLLAVHRQHSRRGLGSLLLATVEQWLASEGVRCVVSLAGLDTVPFWQARGYSEDNVTLEPEWWALLRDPFGSSKILAKWLV